MNERLYKLLEFIMVYVPDMAAWGVMSADKKILYIGNEWAETAAAYTGFAMDELTEYAGYWYFDDTM